MKQLNWAQAAKAGQRPAGPQVGSRQVVEESIDATKDGRQLSWEMSASTNRPANRWDNLPPAAGERPADKR